MGVAITCDMGEPFGLYRMGDDEGIMPDITIANLACGFHGSDPVVMRTTVRQSKAHGVKVGAHPSPPDLQGFGRRAMSMERDELSATLIYQVGALKAFLNAEDMAFDHIKPHGALYGMANTLHEEIYIRHGIGFVARFDVDLDYDGNEGLIITREHTAWDPGEAAERTPRAVTEGVVRSVDDTDVPMRADSLCVHFDTPGAVVVAKAVFDAVKPHLD
ncbi:MAG: LamB/YcsF family protein [Alphaproteobacteria bacterium]|jgi:UPF0271 protein|nr:LamB/YcsF family protein [Alphaproteobacteria bacterium]MDP6517134.1 LamB/YcsF family protein [Alphaproteobacteria bacterium]